MKRRSVQPRQRASKADRLTVRRAIRQLPAYLRLLFGLMRDYRVSRVDRLLVFGALAYVIAPLDFIPDIIPFFGQVDDVFLVMLALQRMVERSNEDVLLDHWDGDPDDLDNLNLAGIVASAGFFLPISVRRRLRNMARR